MKKMSKERYEEIIDGAYKLYSNEYEKDNSIGLCLLVQRVDGRATYRKPDREMFIGLCTHDASFSEKWGLKIEERELSEKERLNTLIQNEQRLIYQEVQSFKNVRRKKIKDCLDERNIPTRAITLTYNNETIEFYE